MLLEKSTLKDLEVVIYMVYQFGKLREVYGDS